MSSPQTRILLMGIEPLSGCAILPPSTTTATPLSLDGPTLKAELDASIARCRAEPDWDVDVCWFDPLAARPAASLEAHLRATKPGYDVLVVGWGVRGLPAFRDVFEDVVGIIRRDTDVEATRVVFSNQSGDHLESVRRFFPRK